MNKQNIISPRLQRILRGVIIFGTAVIIIVPLDISGWLTALLRSVF